MKLIISIKHTIFISSFILFILIYHILFLQDLLFIFTVLLFYLLLNINIIIYLLIFEISIIINLNYPSYLDLDLCSSYLPFLLVDLLNLRHYTIIIYMLLIYN